VIASSLLLTASLAGAAFSCPATIEDEQHVKNPRAQSIRYYSGPRMLESMATFVGHPSKRMQPQPDGWSHKGIYVWEFTPGNDIWVECTYQNSAAVLTFHVGTTRKCSFTKSHGGLNPNVGLCEAAAP